MGRPKGSPNKVKKRAKEAIADVVENNTHKIEHWLEEIERVEGPLEAYKAFMQIIEYHIPKLSRAEVTGEDGGPVEGNIRVEIVRPSSGTDS